MVSEEQIDAAIQESKQKACSLEGYRFIVEQLAALNEPFIRLIDIVTLVEQARFALKAERELRLQELRDRVDCSSIPQATDEQGG